MRGCYSGKRVFGIVTKGACATLLDVEVESIVEIPDCMTLEEAATVPVVYCTSYFALFKVWLFILFMLLI